MTGTCQDRSDGGVVVWRTVVLPALSRPRKSSLACLLARPSWASTSQNQSMIHMMVVWVSVSEGWQLLAVLCCGSVRGAQDDVGCTRN